jgi:hypothetical protein
MIDMTNGLLQATKKFAETHNDGSFQGCLDCIDVLERLDKKLFPNDNSEITLFADYFSHCFYFIQINQKNDNRIEIVNNGSIVYFKQYDNFAKMFCKQENCPIPIKGWEIY